MKTIKGPAIYLAQFLGDKAPFDTLENMATWAASLGYKGIQVPVDARLIDLEQAATSQTYCDELLGVVADAGVEITELATHLQGQLVAVHPDLVRRCAGWRRNWVSGCCTGRRAA